MKYIVATLLLFCFAGNLLAQETSGSLNIDFNPYTSLRTHYAILDKESELQDNASRIGMSINVGKGSGIRFIGQIELSLRLIESTTILNADSRTTSGFIIFNSSQEGQVFGARLGYLGVDLGDYGTITIGKQWSTYYDVSGFTDRFNVFGGTTANTYAGGTDGSIGTGRSDQSFIYRFKPGKWHFGMQLLFTNTNNDVFVDGYGGVVRYSLTPEFSLGGAYQYAILANNLIQGTLGLEGDPEYFCFGATYEDDRLLLSAVYARQSNGDLTVGLVNENEFPSVVYNDSGLELAVGYRLKKWKFLGGVNMEWAETDDLPIHPDYHTENYLMGMEYHPNKLAYFYAEARLDQGFDSRGNKLPNVFTFGLRIDLSHEGKKIIRFAS